MKETIVDTDILSEFLKGNDKVAKKFNEYLKEFNIINFIIITYFEILNRLLYKVERKQLVTFEMFIESNTVLPLTIESVNIAQI